MFTSVVLEMRSGRKRVVHSAAWPAGQGDSEQAPLLKLSGGVASWCTWLCWGLLGDSAPEAPVPAQDTVFSANVPGLRADHRTSVMLHQVQNHLLAQERSTKWYQIREACASHPPTADTGFVEPISIQLRNKEKQLNYKSKGRDRILEGACSGQRLQSLSSSNFIVNYVCCLPRAVSRGQLGYCSKLTLQA